MFLDGLKDIGRISTKTITTNNLGEQIEEEEIRFDNIKCRLGVGSFAYNNNNLKARNNFIYKYKFYTELQYGNIERGNYIYVNGNFEKKFIIIGGQEAKGRDSNHYIYTITEYEQYTASS